MRFQRLLLTLAALALLVPDGSALPQSEERTKSIRGVVRDLRGQPVQGARVFVRHMDSNVIRTLTTGADGLYSVSGLPTDVDYEVHAEFEGTESARRLVSAFLPRTDNILHFELEMAVIPSGAPDSGDGFVIETFDRVQLRAAFETPVGAQAPIPAALLLHGFGESRAVWRDLEVRLLERGWAVLTLDLRGHGESRIRNREPFEAVESWRTDPGQFPLDLEPAIDWLRSQPRLDSNRIVVIGAGTGANLALIAGGRFQQVATVVALNPNLEDALRLAGTARDFQPRMAHLIVNDAAEGGRIREHITGASRITVTPASGGTAAWLATRNTIDEIMRWLRDVY